MDSVCVCNIFLQLFARLMFSQFFFVCLFFLLLLLVDRKFGLLTGAQINREKKCVIISPFNVKASSRSNAVSFLIRMHLHTN